MLFDREQKSTVLNYYFLERNKITSTSILRLDDYPGVVNLATLITTSSWRFAQTLWNKNINKITLLRILTVQKLASCEFCVLDCLFLTHVDMLLCRQAELLERKRQKKLRQKEQRSKEQKLEEKTDIEGSVDETIEDVLLEESSSPQTECHSERDSLGILPDHTPSSIETSQHSLTDEDEDSVSHSGFHSGYPEHLPTDHNGEQQKLQMNGHKHVISQWQALPKTQRGLSNGFRADQNCQGLKNGDMRRHGNHVQSRVAPIVNGKKVWSRKPKPERDGDRFQARIQEEATVQAEEIKSHEVLIGSISVALGNCNQESKDPVGTPDDCQDGHQTPKKINNHLEKFIKPDSIQTATNRVMVKLWRPVSRNGTKYAMPDQSENGESEAEVITEKLEDQALLNSYSPHSLDGDTGDFGNNSLIQEEPAPIGLEFSSRAAKAFLAQSKFTFETYS